MPDSRRHKGDQGEALAAKYLKKLGYKILEKNYRSGLGEIDIIARDHATLVFVEVKTRHSARFGPSKAAVTLAKQKKISLVALEYLSKKRQAGKKARFDVVGIDWENAEPKIEIIKNAFELALP